MPSLSYLFQRFLYANIPPPNMKNIATIIPILEPVYGNLPGAVVESSSGSAFGFELSLFVVSPELELPPF